MKSAVCWLILVSVFALNAAELRIVRLDEADAAVGKTMTWVAISEESGDFRYRFQMRKPGDRPRMIRDFGPDEWLDWAAEREGAYEVEVSRVDLSTGEFAVETVPFYVDARVYDGRPRVNPTDHPLVFLFSAPVCEIGDRMRVVFELARGGSSQHTPYSECNGESTMNFLLAGLIAETDYVASAELEHQGATRRGDAIPFRTGELPTFSWHRGMAEGSTAGSTLPLLLSTAGGSQVATDLFGNVVWFNPAPVSFMTSFEAGGMMWGFVEDGQQPMDRQTIRKVDLLGHTVLETNAKRVNEQLLRLGKRPISGFHHDVRTLSDGRIVALASVEQLLTDVQGPGTVDVLGDMIVVLDEDLQVVWTWDAFDHLDVRRPAVLGEVCPPNGAGCPPIVLGEVANDWTHGNAVLPTPDGDLLYSSRHQDWLIKVHYNHGDGDGHVVWRLGKDGDFAYAGGEAFPWFSHQHDGKFEGLNQILVFDNGNTRIDANGDVGESRGQLIQLDEKSMTATLLMNAGLGVYSQAVGSAQSLGNGRYHFEAGCVPNARGFDAYAIEVDRSGRVLNKLHANTLIYRSIRMSNLYGLTD